MVEALADVQPRRGVLHPVLLEVLEETNVMSLVAGLVELLLDEVSAFPFADVGPDLCGAVRP